MKTAIRLIILFFWILYSSLMIMFTVTSFLVNPNLVIGDKFKAFITQSGSMIPTINVGDVIIDDVSLKRDPRSGDIITFKDPGGHIVTHRVIGVSADGKKVLYTTKGDNNEDEDPDKITKENIIGFYKARIPFVGYLVVYLGKPAGLILLIIMPVILTALKELVKNNQKTIKGEKKSNRSEGEVQVANSDQNKSELRQLELHQSLRSQVSDNSDIYQTQSNQINTIRGEEAQSVAAAKPLASNSTYLSQPTDSPNSSLVSKYRKLNLSISTSVSNQSSQEKTTGPVVIVEDL